MRRDPTLCGGKCKSATATQLSWQLLPRFSNSIWKPAALERLSQDCICCFHFWRGKSCMSVAYLPLRTSIVNKGTKLTVSRHFLNQQNLLWDLRFSPLLLIQSILQIVLICLIDLFHFWYCLCHSPWCSICPLPSVSSVGNQKCSPFETVCVGGEGAFCSASAFKVDCKKKTSTERRIDCATMLSPPQIARCSFSKRPQTLKRNFLSFGANLFLLGNTEGLYRLTETTISPEGKKEKLERKAKYWPQETEKNSR